MKILVLTPLTPLKIEGGLQRRVYNIWSRLGKKHQIFLVSSDSNRLEPIIKKEGQITYIRLKQNNNKVLNLLKCVLTGLIPTVFKHNSKATIEFCQQLEEKEKFDLIVCDHLWLAPTALKLKTKKKILLSHGWEYIIQARWRDQVSSLIKPVLYFLSRQMENWEKNIITKFTAVSGVSLEETKEIMGLGLKANQTEVIANGTNLPKLNKRDNKKDNLLFLGSLDYLPNDDGLKFFFKEVYPFLQDIEINIVGRGAKPWLKKLAGKNKQIKILGRVPKVEPYIEQATICLAPLRMGSGSRLKILEYFSLAKPVVATTVAAEGIDYTNQKNIIIEDQGKKFAQVITDLLLDKNQQATLGQAARKLVEEKYSWDKISQDLDMWLKSLK